MMHAGQLSEQCELAEPLLLLLLLLTVVHHGRAQACSFAGCPNNPTGQAAGHACRQPQAAIKATATVSTTNMAPDSIMHPWQ
jgi:hypothetical protein